MIVQRINIEKFFLKNVLTMQSVGGKIVNVIRQFERGNARLIKTDLLRGRMAEKGISQPKMAKLLKMSPATFYRKMRKGVFDSSEIEIFLKHLGYDSLLTIFFPKK